VLVACGIGSGLTGFGGDLIVCDDLVRDRADAESPAVRASTLNWFNDVLRTRAHPGAAMLMIGTRWSENDILGSVCFEGDTAGQWEKLVLPLYPLADVEDPLGRKPGEMLWPARFSAADVPSVEKGEISSRSHAAIYLCSPRAVEGNTFKSIWFSKRYRNAPATGKSVLAIDCASKLGVQNCTSAFAVIRKAVDYFVLAVESDQLEFIDLERRVISLADKWHPTMVLVEDASAGTQIVQRLKKLTSLPIEPVVAKLSKLVRAELVTGLFESKRVLFPDEIWADEMVEELCRFPSGKNDRTDALVHGITYLDKSRSLWVGGGQSFVDDRPSYDVDYRDPRQWRAS
jgi:predicted phage terminase large subunit-like protein